jgi:hypothetical protein
MDPDRSLSTEENHDQSLRGEQNKVVRGHTIAQGNKSDVLGVGALGRHRVVGSETSTPLIGRGSAILTAVLTTVLTATILLSVT